MMTGHGRVAARGSIRKWFRPKGKRHQALQGFPDDFAERRRKRHSKKKKKKSNQTNITTPSPNNLKVTFPTRALKPLTKPEIRNIEMNLIAKPTTVVSLGSKKKGGFGNFFKKFRFRKKKKPLKKFKREVPGRMPRFDPFAGLKNIFKGKPEKTTMSTKYTYTTHKKETTSEMSTEAVSVMGSEAGSDVGSEMVSEKINEDFTLKSNSNDLLHFDSKGINDVDTKDASGYQDLRHINSPS